jgi:crotonobetainyl-CoA:carnitine CoA-transferase CaiB-like acyl-CoA transferase
MYTIGLPEREPLKIGGNAALYTTGMSAFSATMLALYVRDTQGYGQHVEVSAMETITVSQIHSSLQHQLGRTLTRRESTLVRAQDGWVQPGLERGVRADTWRRVCALIGRPAARTGRRSEIQHPGGASRAPARVARHSG